MAKRRWRRIIPTTTLVVAAIALGARHADARPRSAAPSRSQTASTAPPPDRWSVAAGVLDVLPLPGMDDNNLYAFAGVARVMPRGSFILVPGLGVEMAPANRRWGLVASLTIDVPVSDVVGIDLGLALLTDQTGGHFGQALISGGAGPGVSITVGAWTISPSISVFRDIRGSRAWTLIPALQLSRAL